MRSMAPPMRAAYGFVAGAVAVLVFHQGAWAALHLAGLMSPPYPMSPAPPFGVPLTVDFCFWGGVWGLAYGLALPKLTMPPWLSGLVLGLIATLVSAFVVEPLKGHAPAFGWAPKTLLVVLVILAVWGIGVGLTMQALTSRTLRRT